MSKEYIISIDLGTTGNRVFCFDTKGLPISNVYREFTQYFPKPGWVEHDPMEIWNEINTLIPEAIKEGGLNPNDALSIGITNQRETTVVWNKKNGKPIYNAIVWQCRRTIEICNNIKEKGLENIFREKTGLVVDAYFSGSKIKWILDNVDNARELAEKGDLVFGTIDTWILWNLTNGKSHKTDFTNASRTLIFDIKEKIWSKELIQILDIPETMLPEVHNSASNFGVTSNLKNIPDGIIIGGIAGDQQAAMVGQNCVFEGTSKNTYGTGCFVLMNNGNNFIISKNGLLTTLTCDNYGKPVYALEGSVFIGGAAIQWIRDQLDFFDNSSESEKLANSVDQDDEVVLVPAFVGLGAPYWKMDTKGAIFGLTRDTSKSQITRAAIKSIAFQSMDVINAMEEDTGKKLQELKVDGGATANNFLMQFQANILDIPILLPQNRESTALGAAYLAGLSIGLYKTIDEIAQNNNIKSQFVPHFNKKEKEREINLWKDAIKRLII